MQPLVAVLRRPGIIQASFSRGGGYVFNPVHNIYAGTPVRNIVARLKRSASSASPDGGAATPGCRVPTASLQATFSRKPTRRLSTGSRLASPIPLILNGLLHRLTAAALPRNPGHKTSNFFQFPLIP